MAQPVVHYDGNYVTCYPGSNQSDDGKLNMEFNMARLVTRVTSKNFCTVNPSYELSLIQSNTGRPQIKVGEGQCSINGMDLIMSTTITIDEPETPGDYYLIFKLYRDGSDNVKGDDVYGVTTTFMGVYLTYVTEKPEPQIDKDVLYLGKFHYDGETITDLEEDEDKYGRIWAEDVLCKISDSKHPDITRLNLQEFIYKIPDWYVSKEGDVEYGAIDFMASRLTEGTYGIHIQAKDDNTSELIMKSALTSTTDADKILKVFAKDTGIQMLLGKSVLTSDSNNKYALELTTPNNIMITTDDILKMVGKNAVQIGTGTAGRTPQVMLINDIMSVMSNTNSQLTDDIIFNKDYLTHRIGLADFKFSGNKLALLGDDVSTFEINPAVDMTTLGRVRDTLYIGNESTYGNERTYLKKNEWKLSNDSANNTMTPSSINVLLPATESGQIGVGAIDNSRYSKLFSSGNIELYNNSAATKISFKDGASGYDTSIYKTYNSKTLNIDSTLLNVLGNLTASGDIRANKVYNAVYNDIVEFMEKADYDEVIEPGDVVYFNNEGKVTKWHEGINSTAIAGVVSSEETYGYALGGAGLEDNQKVPIALKGRVYVKTDNIMIEPGDIIAVDSCGCVYKQGHSEIDIFTLGIATKPEKDGKVYIMIK